MQYTKDQMIRDLMVPICVAIIFAAVWLGISGIESAMGDQPFWKCVLHPACGGPG